MSSRWNDDVYKSGLTCLVKLKFSTTFRAIVLTTNLVPRKKAEEYARNHWWSKPNETGESRWFGNDWIVYRNALGQLAMRVFSTTLLYSLVKNAHNLAFPISTWLLITPTIATLQPCQVSCVHIKWIFLDWGFYNVVWMHSTTKMFTLGWFLKQGDHCLLNRQFKQVDNLPSILFLPMTPHVSNPIGSAYKTSTLLECLNCP